MSGRKPGFVDEAQAAPVAEAPSTVTLPLKAKEPTKVPRGALPLAVTREPPLRRVRLPRDRKAPRVPTGARPAAMVPPSAIRVTGVA